MVRVVVIHYTERGRLPRVPEERRREIFEKLVELLKRRPHVKFNGTYVDDNGVGICEWEAPSAEAVEEVLRALGTPYDAVVEVKQELPPYSAT